MGENGIFLRDKGDIVGYARYVSVPETGLPSEVIHGHHLSSCAKQDECLVAIYGVQIFSEFETRRYPYTFKSFEDLPGLLGDLNRADKAFKQVVAWDKNKIVGNSHDPVPNLGDSPRNVSVRTIDSIRKKLGSSPTKVRFNQTVRAVYPHEGNQSSQEANEVIELNEKCTPRHHPDLLNKEVCSMTNESDVWEISDDSDQDNAEENILSPDHSGLGRFEESVDQFELELQAEEEKKALEQSMRKERKEAAAEMYLRELDEEVDNDVPLESGFDDVSKRDEHVHGGTNRVRRDRLSPTERISLRIKRKGNGRSAATRRESLSPISKSRKIYDAATSGSNPVDYSNTFSRGEPSSAQAYNHSEDIASSGQPDERGEGNNGRIENTQNFSHTVLRTCDMGDSCIGDNALGPCSEDVLVVSPPPEDKLQVTSGIKKRSYRFKNRIRATKKPLSARGTARLELVRISHEQNPFLTSEHCCNDGCFTRVNHEYAAVQYRRFLLMDRVERKRSLKFMYNRQANKFWFDGLPVCSRFLVKLSFSNQLQSAVKGTLKARASSSVLACPRDVRRDSKKDQIIRFLKGIAGALGDALPTKDHYNLPLVSKFQVYERFLKSLTPGEEHVSFSYFCDVWKEHCSQIKNHRRHGFTVCIRCEKLRSSLAKCESAAEEATIRAQMDLHYKQMAEERRGYAERVDLTKRFPDKYLSIIVDGADQKNYGLPHFLFHTKNDHGHKLKVKCVGVLEHGLHKHLSLFTMTEEFESGANHVLEAIHRVLNRKKQENGRLPEVLFIQADNCTRENKNRYFMSYCEMLVAMGVFLQVQVSFLPIGHTHADIDQAFSTVANRLRLFDAITMEHLLEELNNCYNPRASAEQIEKVANFSGLCEASRCSRKVHGFSQYRYFRFTRSKAEESFGDGESDGRLWDPFSTTCDVKIQIQDEWAPIHNSPNRLGFLKFVPNLRDTPATNTSPPENVQEVNKHLQSCEDRIGTETNMKSLVALRDKVYTRRMDDFHWDIETCYELNGDHRGTGSAHKQNGSNISQGESSKEKLDYSLNSFLAVKPESQSRDAFWIARTLQIAKTNSQGSALLLKVRWYQAKKGSKDPFSARYDMSTYVIGTRRQFFDDTVDVRSVLCQFDSLTQNGGLHVRTQKAIRQCLDLN